MHPLNATTRRAAHKGGSSCNIGISPNRENNHRKNGKHGIYSRLRYA